MFGKRFVSGSLYVSPNARQNVIFKAKRKKSLISGYFCSAFLNLFPMKVASFQA